MFCYEREMIPVLKKSLSIIYETKYFIEEFQSGFGIADLVFTKGLIKRDIFLRDFEALYYLTEHFNKKDKEIYFEDIIKRYSLKKKKAYLTIDFLKTLELASEVDKGILLIKKTYSPATQEIYSIEAKLKDWRMGLHQALKYKTYSHKTFLAISEEYVNRVNISTLKTNNVGLISVNEEGAEIRLYPKTKPPFNKTSYHYSSETFVSRFMD